MGHEQYPSGFPPALPSIVEHDGYRVLQSPLPPFMDKWLKPGSERLDSYPLPELESPSSSKIPEVGSPPRKRSRPFAGDASPVELSRLHGSTLPMLQPPQPPQPPHTRSFDPDKVQAELTASQNRQKSTPKTPELRKSCDPVDTYASLPSGSHAKDLDPRAFVDLMNDLPLAMNQKTMRELGQSRSYEKMVEFAKGLETGQCLTLLTHAWMWMLAPHPSERNPDAAQLTALLVVFSSYTPNDVDKFMRLLPLSWPHALEHLRKDCLDRRAALLDARYSPSRDEFLRRLTERYGG